MIKLAYKDNVMAKKPIKSNLKSDKSTYEEQLMALVENLDDKIKLVAEGNLMLGERMERGFAAVDKKFAVLERKMDIGFEKVWDRFDAMDGRIDFLEKDMHGSYKTVIEYLSRIENELVKIKVELKRLDEKKADKEILADLAKRIAKIERDMEQCKILCKDK
jgi:hypothetical protein